MTSKRAQRAQERYDRAKAATERAAGAHDDAQEELRGAMEARKKHAPAKLTRKQMRLARQMDDGSGGEVKPKKLFGR